MTAAIDETQVGTELTYRALFTTHHDTMVNLLVSDHAVPPVRAEAMIDQLWDRLVAGIVQDHAVDDVNEELAALIMNEALGYLQAAEANSGYPPSELVDYGWHKFRDFSMEYDVFSKAIAGRHLHHAPEGLVLPPDYSDEWVSFTIDDTVAAMALLGPVNALLWVHPGGCDGCCNMRCTKR
jgi:hypothetical protein